MTPRILVAVTLAAIAIGVSVTAQRVSESELLLREALHKQQVQGDLPGAIKIYQQIVSARNGDRSVSGRALLELAGCYEKLGQQADFSDIGLLGALALATELQCSNHLLTQWGHEISPFVSGRIVV